MSPRSARRRRNRGGLIAGATGTGKTVTLQGIAEDFSREGVPVFLADVKGDLSGIAMRAAALALALWRQVRHAGQPRIGVREARRQGAASSSIGRQIANQVGREVFGGGRSSSGGLVGSIARGVLGSLLRGR